MNEHVVVADVLSEFLEVAIHMILFIRGVYPPELFESRQKYNCPIKAARHPGLISYIQQIVRSIRSELQKDTIHRICVVTLDPAGKAIDRFVFEMSMLRPFKDQILNDINQHINNTEPTNSRVDKGKSRAMEPYDIPRADIGSDEDHNVYGADIFSDDQADSHGYDADDEPLHRNTVRERMQPHKNQQQFRPAHNSLYSESKVSRMKENPRFGGMMTLTTDVEAMLRAMLLKISICDSYLKPLVQDCSFTVVIEMEAPGGGPDSKPEFLWSPISTNVLAEQSKLSPSLAQFSPNRKIIPVKTIDIADIQFELFIEKMEIF